MQRTPVTHSGSDTNLSRARCDHAGTARRAQVRCEVGTCLPAEGCFQMDGRSYSGIILVKIFHITSDRAVSKRSMSIAGPQPGRVRLKCVVSLTFTSQIHVRPVSHIVDVADIILIKRHERPRGNEDVVDLRARPSKQNSSYVGLTLSVDMGTGQYIVCTQ
jgi:hypothetical protein